MTKKNETQETSLPVPEFFYTTNYPHRMSSGPDVWTLNPDTMRPIESLAEAKELAERFYLVTYEEDHCETSYGLSYPVKQNSNDFPE